MFRRIMALSFNQKLVLLLMALSILVAIVAPFLSGHDWFPGRSDEKETEYVGRVLDSNTLQPLAGAKITLDLESRPEIAFTDSEGVYRFSVAITQATSCQIRVDANGYKVYSRNITITPETRSLQDIRLVLVP